MKEIQLYGSSGAGLVMLVDDSDYDLMNQHKWYLHFGYAIAVKYAGGGRANQKHRNLIAHRYLLGLEKGDGSIVDHINGNRLDNRRDNLRLVDTKQSTWNTKSYAKSGYKGVIRQGSTFTARAGRVHLGQYPTPEMAALAHDQWVRENYGEYGKLNFPEVTDYSEVVRSPEHNPHPRTSTVKGVSYSHTRRAKAKWRAVVRSRHLGWFHSEEQAIEALRRYSHEG